MLTKIPLILHFKPQIPCLGKIKCFLSLDTHNNDEWWFKPLILCQKKQWNKILFKSRTQNVNSFGRNEMKTWEKPPQRKAWGIAESYKIRNIFWENKTPFVVASVIVCTAHTSLYVKYLCWTKKFIFLNKMKIFLIPTTLIFIHHLNSMQHLFPSHFVHMKPHTYFLMSFSYFPPRREQQAKIFFFSFWIFQNNINA